MLQPLPERAEDAPEIETLLDLAFGPDRQARVSYRYRRGIAPVAALSRVVRVDDRPDGAMIGSIRYWPILVGQCEPALLLGPLAIHPARQNTGVGRALAFGTLDAARDLGYRVVLLVGAQSYYGRFGFTHVPTDIVMPDEQPERVLGLALVAGALAAAGGEVRRADGRSASAGDGAQPISDGLVAASR